MRPRVNHCCRYRCSAWSRQMTSSNRCAQSCSNGSAPKSAAGDIYEPTTSVAACRSSYQTAVPRTVFTKPSVKFAYGQFLIAEKWIPSGLLTNQQLRVWSENQAAFAYWLFFHNDPRAAQCLRVVAWRVKKIRYFVLAAVSSLGFERRQIKGIASIFGFGNRDP